MPEKDHTDVVAAQDKSKALGQGAQANPNLWDVVLKTNRISRLKVSEIELWDTLPKTNRDYTDAVCKPNFGYTKKDISPRSAYTWKNCSPGNV